MLIWNGYTSTTLMNWRQPFPFELLPFVAGSLIFPDFVGDYHDFTGAVHSEMQEVSWSQESLFGCGGGSIRLK